MFYKALIFNNKKCTIKMQREKLKEDAEGLIERAEILRWGNVNNKVLLDVGAGPLAIIAARDFNCTVTNIDVSEDALVDTKRDAEKEGLAEQIVFEHGDATSLSYPNGSFDVVICYGTLHHIEPEGRRKCLHELHRVAKEKVIVVEFTPEGFAEFHAFSSYKHVDLDWLELELNSLGEVETYSGTLMNVYTLKLLEKV
jgi:ubiquinone/menaquinone biosynthesis C-methylase UbiE